MCRRLMVVVSLRAATWNLEPGEQTMSGPERVSRFSRYLYYLSTYLGIIPSLDFTIIQRGKIARCMLCEHVPWYSLRSLTTAAPVFTRTAGLRPSTRRPSIHGRHNGVRYRCTLYLMFLSVHTFAPPSSVQRAMSPSSPIGSWRDRGANGDATGAKPGGHGGAENFWWGAPASKGNPHHAPRLVC